MLLKITEMGWLNNSAISGGKMKVSLKAVVVQFIKFGLVGTVNTVLSYIIFNLCYYVFKTSVHVGNIAAFVITVFIAFLLQSRFVFTENESGKKRVWWKVLIKTYISYSFTGLFLTELLLILWLDIIDISRFLSGVCSFLESNGITFSPEDLAVSISPILNLMITIPLNFLINKLWAYRQKDKTADCD